MIEKLLSDQDRINQFKINRRKLLNNNKYQQHYKNFILHRNFSAIDFELVDPILIRS
jgi:hypothetical protein